MSTTTIKQVQYKLKNLPESLLNEVDNYIDFLTFKYSSEVPEWNKEIVLKRIKENKQPTDTLEMIKDLER